MLDAGPTLLCSAKIEIPDPMQGTDLRAPFSARSEEDQQVFSAEDHVGNVLWSIQTEDEKLIVANLPGNI